jgi:hypothetical protein
LCIGTGQRIGDVLGIRWSHLKNGAYDFTQGKTDKELWIPLPDIMTGVTVKPKGVPALWSGSMSATLCAVISPTGRLRT